jgi:NADH dehydrogenase
MNRLAGVGPCSPFKYVDRGEIAVIGRGSAVACLFGMRFWGYAAWLLWVFVHLARLVEFRSRVLVFIQWGFQYCTFARGARLITGTTPPGIADAPQSNERVLSDYVA